MEIRLGTTEEMLQEQLTDYTKDGHCSDCGSCCSNILPMAESEIERIRKYIKKHDIKAQVHCAVLASDALDMMCPFMDMKREHHCTIYSIRPQICRSFLCNKNALDALKDPELWIEDRQLTNVRETFFGGKEK